MWSLTLILMTINATIIPIRGDFSTEARCYTAGRAIVAARDAAYMKEAKGTNPNPIEIVCSPL